MRAYKTVNDTYIEPISFTVPRRAETFQSDIYPPATGLKPAVSAKEWLDGKSGLPPKIDLESVYEGHAPVEVPADYKPPSAVSTPPSSAKPAQKEFEGAKPALSPPAAAANPAPAAAPAPARGPPPSTADQKASISAMASKYKEQEDSGSDGEEASTFDEVTRPAPRGPPREEAKPVVQRASPPVSAKPSPALVSRPAPTPAPAPAQSPAPAAAPAGAGAAAPSSNRASGEVSTSLKEIKEMMQAQQGLLKSQSEQIGLLTHEVETLRRRVGSGGAEQSERIRQLELELEAARS